MVGIFLVLISQFKIHRILCFYIKFLSVCEFLTIQNIYGEKLLQCWYENTQTEYLPSSYHRDAVIDL